MDTDEPRGTPGAVGGGRPAAVPDDEESPNAPSIPSFASLRDTRRRSPADLLVQARDVPVDPAPPPAPAPRPAEWADLWHLGLRVARWALRQPLETARRLIG